MSTVCSRAFDTTTSREPAAIAADAVAMQFNRGRERRGVVPRLCVRAVERDAPRVPASSDDPLRSV